MSTNTETVRHLAEAGAARIQADLPHLKGVHMHVVCSYHPRTADQFDALVDALGGLEAAEPVSAKEAYAIGFVRRDRQFDGGLLVSIQVYKPSEVRPELDGPDPFFGPLAERQRRMHEQAIAKGAGRLEADEAADRDLAEGEAASERADLARSERD